MGGGGVLILNVEEVKGVKHTHHQSSDTKNVISFKVSDRGFILDTKKKTQLSLVLVENGTDRKRK